MTNTELDKGAIAFQAEGRLLQELGLRLVAKPEVALLELIKNAYDADSAYCAVTLENKAKTLVISDAGHGMTIGDFKDRWMRVATSGKLGSETSPRLHRPLTGAKGIGRFAVRYLGDHLVLKSRAFDKKHGFLTELEAEFDWAQLDDSADIKNVPIPYVLRRAAPEAEPGTTLVITKLRGKSDFTKSKDLRDQVLRLVSPLQGLERGAFKSVSGASEKDPGFVVTLPQGEQSADLNLAKLVLDNYWAKLTIRMRQEELSFRIWFQGREKPRALDVKMKSLVNKGFFADIRFFPRRKGVFAQKGLHGQKAWRWVRDNCGVKVVDHGFLLRPYGFPDDDWLKLDMHKAHSRREWATKIANDHFPLSPVERSSPKVNPVLNLPYNFQIVGAVFVQSHRAMDAKDEADLVPAMDREGLLENAAYDQLKECVRAGIEFLAREDKNDIDRRATKFAKQAAQDARQDIKKAIEFVESLPGLTPTDKSRMIKRYEEIADRLDEHEAYAERSREGLITMGLLGVVAGFMMHESKAIVHDLEGAADLIRGLTVRHPEFKVVALNLENRLTSFRGYLEYARMFVGKVRSSGAEPLNAAGQVRHVIDRFSAFAKEHGITVVNEIDKNLLTPPLPVTAYSGILLNLFTNALKASIALQDRKTPARIAFRAWNENSRHFVEVLDNGIGIPPEIQKRIWDPLFTTTSDVGNPLGSGMGLGLSLVKQVVAEYEGKIALLTEGAPGYTTCFQVSFPMKSEA